MTTDTPTKPARTPRVSAHDLEKRGRRVTLVKGHHSSGRWDEKPGDLRKAVRDDRAGGRSFGSRTELTQKAMAAVVENGKPSWEVFHPSVMGGDLAWEWDPDVWDALEPIKVKLDDGGTERKGGGDIPPGHLVGMAMRHRDSNAVLAGATFHLSLLNTEARRELQLVQMHSIRKWGRGLHRTHPDWVISLQGDGNCDCRSEKNRDKIRTQMLAGTGAKNLWVPPHLPSGGTHGRRALLDFAATDAHGATCRIMARDNASDHVSIELTIPLPLPR